MAHSLLKILNIECWKKGGVLLWFFAFTGTGTGAAIELEDDLGMVVKMDTPPQRIVSLAPSNTELLFALELGDKLVGVTEFCNYPQAALAIEKIAGYSSLSIEKILAVEPDLILAARGNDIEGLGSLRKMGFKVYALDIQNVEQLVEAMERLGRLTGVESRASVLVEAWKVRLAQLNAGADSLEARPRVMWGYWGETIFTAGKGNIIDDVINLICKLFLKN